jgi:hypothetical protein
MAGVFPYLPDLSSLVENGQDKTKLLKPQSKFTIGLKAFFKFDGSVVTTGTFNPTIGPPTNSIKTKRIKFWFETTEGTYQFNLIFNMMRYRTFLKPGGGTNANDI